MEMMKMKNNRDDVLCLKKSGNEYDTKKAYYNPKIGSPNTFLMTLERRMEIYGEYEFNDFSSFSLLNDEKNDCMDKIKK